MSNTIKYNAVGGLSGNQYQLYAVTLTIDTYATGGVDVPFKGVTPIQCLGCENVSGTITYQPVMDLANKKIKLFTDNATSGVPAEVSAGSITSTKFDVSFMVTID